MCSEATSTTSPPRPPSPPSGPPRGRAFSRRNEILPSPPLPARTRMRASSRNTGGRPSSGRWTLYRRRRRRVDGDLAAGVEADDAVGQGEQSPVAPHADVAAGAELGPALADDDGARGDELAAV